MVKLFWLSYIFAFAVDNLVSLRIFLAFEILQNFILLLMVLLPAASVNEAAKAARDVVISLPSWYPNNYRPLKLHIRRHFMQELSLTLWKIYRIDKPLVISALGSLLSYGILVGTLGAIQST
ncbi:hypothetical protein AVEN_158657-1 [Araneus ventricosus]|uniref:Uncharacterized protein n=1 Tax=Araneus ventricosus TaxID=182803 RepID=A0A4Y2QW78_ARAVE|nr:hypothetical protein AVEN_158657-1 [Araneus ventricosus]